MLGESSISDHFIRIMKVEKNSNCDLGDGFLLVRD